MTGAREEQSCWGPGAAGTEESRELALLWKHLGLRSLRPLGLRPRGHLHLWGRSLPSCDCTLAATQDSVLPAGHLTCTQPQVQTRWGWQGGTHLVEAPEMSFSRPFFSFLMSLSGFTAELFPHAAAALSGDVWSPGRTATVQPPVVVVPWDSWSIHCEAPWVTFQELFAFGVRSVYHQLKKILLCLEAERE